MRSAVVSDLLNTNTSFNGGASSYIWRQDTQYDQYGFVKDAPAYGAPTLAVHLAPVQSLVVHLAPTLPSLGGTLSTSGYIAVSSSSAICGTLRTRLLVCSSSTSTGFDGVLSTSVLQLFSRSLH